MLNGGTDELFGMAGRVVVLTGAGGGLGSHLAVALAELGAHVVLTDIDGDALARVAARLPASVAVAADATDPDAVAGVLQAALDGFGAPDVLVNCAAIGCHTPPEDLALADWRKVIDVDLTGYFAFAAEFARVLIARGRGGSIVNLSSIGGASAIGRGNIAYSVAKAGVDGMTRELAIEWAGYGIRVNSIQPCQIATESLLRLLHDGVATERELVSSIPLGRLARAEDLLGPVLFLAGAASSFVTGVCLPVDGGNLAMNAGATLRPPVPDSES